MRGGCSCLPLDDILRTPDVDMTDDIREELDDDGGTLRTNPRSFQTMKTGFQKFQRKLQKRIIRQQRYLEIV